MTHCYECKYFEKQEDNTGMGECHRYPPVCLIINEEAVFPVLYRANSCGEGESFGGFTKKFLNLENENAQESAEKSGG